MIEFGTIHSKHSRIAIFEHGALCGSVHVVRIGEAFIYIEALAGNYRRVDVKA